MIVVGERLGDAQEEWRLVFESQQEAEDYKQMLEGLMEMHEVSLTVARSKARPK